VHLRRAGENASLGRLLHRRPTARRSATQQRPWRQPSVNRVGDALALTFAQPVAPAEVEEEDEEEEFGGYGGHSSSGGWMR
jgi:hypothetical protein